MIHNEAFERAHRIASAHGHWWTRIVEPRPQGWTVEQIAEAQASAIKAGVSPTMIGLQFATSHSTATGRLEWEVAPDGAVTLHGCRAGRAFGLPALSVTVATATVDLGGNARVVYPRGHAALSAGVVGAVKGALSALGLGDDRVLLALGPEAVALWATEQMTWAIAQVEAERPYGGAAFAGAAAAVAEAQRIAAWAEMRRAPPRRPVSKRPVPNV